MADKIDNTEVTQQTVAGRAQQRDVTWLLGVTLLACESNDSTDLPGITVGFSRYACREKSPLNPAASTKTPKLLGTLSDPLSLSAAGLPWQGSQTTGGRSFPTSNLQQPASSPTLGGRASSALIDGHATLADGHTLLPCLRASLPPFIATLGDGHTVPSENAVTRAPPTKLENLMDTLSSGFGTPFCVKKAKAGLPQGMACLPRGRDLSPACPIPFGLSLTVERFREIVFLVDTPFEIEKGFSPSESATSRKLSRYTFDMFGKGVFIA